MFVLSLVSSIRITSTLFGAVSGSSRSCMTCRMFMLESATRLSTRFREPGWSGMTPFSLVIWP